MMEILIEEIMEANTSIIVYHNATNEMAYIQFSADFIKDESVTKALKALKNPLLRAEQYLWQKIEDDLTNAFDYQRGECLESYAVSNNKYMGQGFYAKVMDTWLFLAAHNGYKHHFGCTLTPLTIKVASNRLQTGWVCWNKYYPYGEFEFEGRKPFAHIQFKNFPKQAGCLAIVNDLQTCIEKVRRAELTQAKL